MRETFRIENIDRVQETLRLCDSQKCSTYLSTYRYSCIQKRVNDFCIQRPRFPDRFRFHGQFHRNYIVSRKWWMWRAIANFWKLGR